jgi:SAM-dependent methyltransferase
VVAKFFQQTSWFGIEFCDLPLELDPLNLANSEFYDVFYDRLMQTYPNYDDFPSYWRDQKSRDASFLSRFISQDSNLLSFGCGIGYLESCLMERLGWTFHVTDFSPYILKYRPDLEKQYLAINDLGVSRFSHILLNQVTYALSEFDLRELMYKMHDCLELPGTLIITFSEIDFSFRESLVSILACFFPKRYFTRVKSMRNMLSKPSEQITSQGWGYHRSKREMIEIAVATGFEVLDFSRFGSQSFLFLKKLPKNES